MENEHVFKKILFLTDGSDPALSAQELAILLAKKLDSEVTVFHVVTHELMENRYKDFLIEGRGDQDVTADAQSDAATKTEMSFETDTTRTSAGAHYSERIEGELTSIYRQQGEEIVADAAIAFKEEGVHADQEVVERKSVAEAVMKEADRENYDLIVMGRNAQKEKEAHLGSVAYKVSRQADIPVLVGGERQAISKVLVPLDGSKGSENALKCAAALSKKLNANLTLLHVQESHLFSLRPEVSMAIGRGILADAAGKLSGMSFEQKLESGDPAKKISEIAEKENFDIIVMGGKGQGGASRSLLGSVSDHVLHYTKHSVLIVK
jgi:nucleotide-binding universal stress UspA family protein